MKRKFRALIVAMCIGMVALVFSAPAGATTQAGPYLLQFAHSARCAAVPDFSKENVQLHQWDCLVDSRELWYLDPVFVSGGKQYYHIRSQFSGKCMNIGSNSGANGAPVIQFTCGDFGNEAFTFLPLPDGYYHVQAFSSGLYVSVNGQSTANGAKLIQWGDCKCFAQYVALF